jgi:hypothetical protein
MVVKIFSLVWLMALASVSFAQSSSYLYKSDSSISISEYDGKKGLFWESSKPRVVEFYSPSCVSFYKVEMEMGGSLLDLNSGFLGRSLVTNL